MAQPYHESQGPMNQMCLLHALNMLIGESRLTKSDMEAACQTLSPDTKWGRNPHRSWMGTGNYDANVALLVLQQQGYEAMFFDARKSSADLIATIDDGRREGFAGLLVNVPGTLGWIHRRLTRHWMVYKGQSEKWWTLDSKASSARSCEDFDGTIADHLAGGDTILIICKAKQAET